MGCRRVRDYVASDAAFSNGKEVRKLDHGLGRGFRSVVVARYSPRPGLTARGSGCVSAVIARGFGNVHRGIRRGVLIRCY